MEQTYEILMHTILTYFFQSQTMSYEWRLLECDPTLEIMNTQTVNQQAIVCAKTNDESGATR